MRDMPEKLLIEFMRPYVTLIMSTHTMFFVNVYVAVGCHLTIHLAKLMQYLYSKYYKVPNGYHELDLVNYMWYFSDIDVKTLISTNTKIYQYHRTL